MVVLQLHFLYLSNGNFVSQKEQIKLVGAETAGGVGGGVDLVAFSSINTVSFSSGCFEVFIIRVACFMFYWCFTGCYLLRFIYCSKVGKANSKYLSSFSKKTKNHNDG